MVQIEESWKEILSEEFDKSYFHALTDHIKAEVKAGKTIYPKGSDIFAAFHYCPFQQVRVVILGQDPYHGVNQAHGLCFSVQKGIAIPPSLMNMYKELKSDLGLDIASHGCLSSWAQQGVLMLNSSLTVRAHEPMSHSKIGWETFTDAVIRKISTQKKNVVFILWGGFARKKKSLIDEDKHHIIESAHPSPLSAYNGFFNSKPYSKVNEYLRANNLGEINWQITE